MSLPVLLACYIILLWAKCLFSPDGRRKAADSSPDGEAVAQQSSNSFSTTDKGKAADVSMRKRSIRDYIVSVFSACLGRDKS